MSERPTAQNDALDDGETCVAPPGNLCLDTGCWDADRCIVARAPHPCGHATMTAGCGGCDPGAVEFMRDDGGPWVRVTPPAVSTEGAK